MSFPPLILPRSTVVSPPADAAVQSVIDPCDIALHLHSKDPYLHSISHAFIEVKVTITKCNPL